MSVTAVFCLSFGVLAVGAVSSLMCGNNARTSRKISLAAVVLSGAGMLYLAGCALTGSPVRIVFGGLLTKDLPVQLSFTVDGLSALFLILISVLSVASAVYASGYLSLYKDRRAELYHFPFLVFVAGMLAAVLASDLVYFLVFWEIMTLASYFLVIYENEDKNNLRAGYIYFFMTHISSAGLILAAVIFAYYSGSFSFASLPAVMQQLAAQHPAVLNVLLALLVIAFGTKAGMYPLGTWLPEAHPAAPASVSALLSGVMIKMGVYGFLRFFVWLLPVSDDSMNWGIVIAAFGVVSMIVGNLRALGEDDCKRLLAQSSIGQMGYILMGIGLGLALIQSSPVLSLVAFTGAIFHVFNHALFKSLLFFNTGSVLYYTGTRDLNRMGGLITVIPASALCALTGALAISGTPPLNGFMSKWLLYQAAIFGGMQYPLFLLFGVAAIFISTVSLAAYIKYLGSAYLGSKALVPLPGRKISKSMTAVELVLAAGCLLLGLLPALPVGFIYLALSASSLGTQLLPVESLFVHMPWSGMQVVNAGLRVSANMPLWVVGALAAGLILAYLLHDRLKTPVRHNVVWNCGEQVEDMLSCYRASNYYLTFKEKLSFFYTRSCWPEWKVPPFLAKIFDLDRWLYDPVSRIFMSGCAGVSRIHTGSGQLYLLFQVVGALLVLALIFYIASGDRYV